MKKSILENTRLNRAKELLEKYDFDSKGFVKDHLITLSNYKKRRLRTTVSLNYMQYFNFL